MATHGEYPPTSLGLDMRKLGMWTFIGSESIFFGTLIANYFRWRGSHEGGLGPEDLDINLTGAGAFVLLMSSLTMVLGLAAIRSGNLKRYKLWIAATAALGLVFIGIQAFEFANFGVEGLGMGSSLFGGAFFALTGFHGLHVVIGVVWLLALLIYRVGKDVSPENATTGGEEHPSVVSVEICGLYWHFVDLVWVFIFTLIYLLP
ncbi:MAG: cytochrome c oxidase subunit 3 [Chloroflexota bacterium]|jgi:cytochrome c oxidase subunit 3/cytochrome o ubiquinol oxidase subunit 3|nr:cytochrome c oxidase subunit 3 [Chloroflexota bacterium]